MGLTASHANPLDSGQVMFHDVVWTFLFELSRVLVISHYVELAHGCIGVINKIGVDRKQFVFMLQQLSIIMKIQPCAKNDRVSVLTKSELLACMNNQSSTSLILGVMKINHYIPN